MKEMYNLKTKQNRINFVSLRRKLKRNLEEMNLKNGMRDVVFINKNLTTQCTPPL